MRHGRHKETGSVRPDLAEMDSLDCEGAMDNRYLRHVVWAGVVTALWGPVVVAEVEEPDLGLGGGDEQALLFEDIPSVFGASKYEQKVNEAPAVVTIVTAEEISRYGYRTLNDVLESLPGFIVTNDRNYSYVNVRGFGLPGDYSTRLLMLLDGARVNDGVYDSFGTGHDGIVDIDLIERIEVIRGPSSSLYGPNAFFGVINVITKRGRDYKVFETAVSAGSDSTKQYRATYGQRYRNGVELMTSATYFKSDGDDLFFPEFDDPATNNGVAEDVDNEKAKSLYGRLSYGDFSLESAYNTRGKDIPTGSYETVFNDSNTHTTDAQFIANLRYEHDFERALSLRGNLSYKNFRYDGDYVYDYSEDDDPLLVVNRDTARARSWDGELALHVRSFERHKLVFGGELLRNGRQDQGNQDLEVYLDDQRDATNWGLYVQDEISLRDDLILNAGVRYDRNASFGGTVNPRMALIYSPLEDTTFKLLYGTAYRAPNAYEQYYHDGSSSQKPSTDLDPETISTTEFAVEQGIGQHLRGVASVYRYRVEDLIALTSDPVDDLLVFDNTEDVKAHGFELQLEGKWPKGWAGRLSYNFQQTEGTETGSTLVNSPRHLAKANMIVPLLPKKVFAGLELLYTGDRKTVQGGKVSDYTVANLTLSAPMVLANMSLSASVYNLFDKGYGDPGGEEHLQEAILQDGRTYRVKLQSAF
jgi:iron complex outermembrane receptor protein